MNYFYQETERLTFRKFTEKDISTWAVFFENNPSLPYLGIPNLSQSNEQLATTWITMQFKRYEESGLGHLAIIEKTSGELIGSAGILPRIIDGKLTYEIAYSLKPTAWGKGYGTEMAKALKQFGFVNNIAPDFISIIHKDNIASMHVAQKNGMTPQYEMEFLGMEVRVYGTKKA